MRAELIGHFEPCMTEIYLHIDARMADYIRTHPYIRHAATLTYLPVTITRPENLTLLFGLTEINVTVNVMSSRRRRVGKLVARLCRRFS